MATAGASEAPAVLLQLGAGRARVVVIAVRLGRLRRARGCRAGARRLGAVAAAGGDRDACAAERRRHYGGREYSGVLGSEHTCTSFRSWVSRPWKRPRLRTSQDAVKK